MVWTSADGLTWEQLPHDDEVFGGRDIDAVVADGPGFVAVGTGAWSSSDGAIWAVVGDPQVSGGSLSGVTAFGSGLVAVGRDDSGGDADAAVWASPPRGGFSATTMPTIVTTTTVGTSTTHAPTTSTSAVSTSTTQPPTTTTTATTTTPLSLSVEVTPSVLTAAPSGEYPYSFSVSVLVYGCTAGQIQFFDAAGGYEGGDLAVCPMDYAAVFGWRWSEHSSYFGTWTVQFVDDTGQQVSTSFTVLEP